MALSPYKILNIWLFDGTIKTPIPKPKYDKEGKEIYPDILNYNSPITHTNIIRMFLRNGKLNHYLNKYFNNINLRYILKNELLIFIKKAIIDFRVKQKDIVYFPYRHKAKLFEKLKKKIPVLKNDDILLLCNIIEKSQEKDTIYHTLGLEKPKAIKIKKRTKQQKISVTDFLMEHFTLEKI